jgi:hypothetical protein
MPLALPIELLRSFSTSGLSWSKVRILATVELATEAIACCEPIKPALVLIRIWGASTFVIGYFSMTIG